MPDHISTEATDYDYAILVEHLQFGQPRHYADSIYEAKISFTGRNISIHPRTTKVVVGCHPGENYVKEIARLLVRPFEDDRSMGNAYLDKIERVHMAEGESTWLVRIIEPYMD